MNTAAINFQRSVTLGSFGIESVPTKTWRDDLKKDGAAKYTHEISGKALVKCEDGQERLVGVELRMFGKKRRSSLGGIVASWAARPTRGATHAQCRTTGGPEGTRFEGGAPAFTEPDIVCADGAVRSPEAGLVLKAALTRGKTLRLAGAELAVRFHKAGPLQGQPVVGADGTRFYEVRRFEGVEVADRPRAAELDDGDEAPASAECASLSAARVRAPAAPAAREEAAPQSYDLGEL